jgi:integrase
MDKSSKATASGKGREKPAKPYPDFPLFAHNNGRWAKKIRQRFVYFGLWDDWQAALDLYQQQRDDLYRGRKPRVTRDGLTLEDLCNHFLAYKESRLDSGEIVQRTFSEYHSTCRNMLEQLGKRTSVEALDVQDFQDLRSTLAKRLGPVALGNEIQRVRSVFGYGIKAKLYKEPVLPEVGFEKPTEKTLRKSRAAKGPKLFTRDQIHALLAEASPRAKSMILLGINGALGNNDLAELPLAALDLKGGWCRFPRPKTGVDRSIPLWTETVEAIREYLTERPEPKDKAASHLLFIGPSGKCFRGNHRGYRVAAEFERLAVRAGVQGRSFYDLRRTFQTIASESGDETATSAIMGHAPRGGDMSARYRQRISEERLRRVSDHVHDWLFGGDR